MSQDLTSKDDRHSFIADMLNKQEPNPGFMSKTQLILRVRALQEQLAAQQELNARLAPDPRVAVLESYGVSTADETACLIMLAARGSRTEIHTTEKLDDTLVLSVIKNLRSIGETQMFASLKRTAAQRGEG